MLTQTYGLNAPPRREWWRCCGRPLRGDWREARAPWRRIQIGEWWAKEACRWHRLGPKQVFIWATSHKTHRAGYNHINSNKDGSKNVCRTVDTQHPAATTPHTVIVCLHLEFFFMLPRLLERATLGLVVRVYLLHINSSAKRYKLSPNI